MIVEYITCFKDATKEEILFVNEYCIEFMSTLDSGISIPLINSSELSTSPLEKLKTSRYWQIADCETFVFLFINVPGNNTLAVVVFWREVKTTYHSQLLPNFFHFFPLIDCFLSINHRQNCQSQRVLQS